MATGLFMVPTLLRAQVMSGGWDKVDRLEPASRMVITLMTGQNIEAGFKRAENEAITVTVDSGEMRIAKSDVRTVVRVTKDRLRNGALTGAGVGFAAGFLALASFNAKVTASGPIWERESVGYYIDAGLIGSGIGAITGLAIDAVRKKQEVIYSR